MSVFEPYQSRDTVQHFCEKHLDKIKSYMESLMVRIPLPVKCTIEERKGRKFAKLHFACQGRTGEYCLYKSSFYTMKTRNPRSWIHLMFLALQVSYIFCIVFNPLIVRIVHRQSLDLLGHGEYFSPKVCIVLRSAHQELYCSFVSTPLG